MNISNGKTREEIQRGVLEAAAVLAEEQRQQDIYARRRAAAELKLDEARDAQEEMECELALAALQLQTAIYNTAVCRRAKTKHIRHNSPSPELVAWSEARKQLFSLPSSADAEVVLNVVRSYGETTSAFWVVHREGERLAANLDGAIQAQRRAEKLHEEALQKSVLVQAAVKLAQEELRGGIRTPWPIEIAQTQLADAAAEFTGTQLQCVALSYAYAKELNIVLPEDVGQ